MLPRPSDPNAAANESGHGLHEGMTFAGPSKTLTDAHFLLFSGITGDTHRSHYDVEYAKEGRFGKPLAHGLLLASMTAVGASEVRDHIEGFVLVEQGCKYLQPAAVGDTVQPRFLVERLWSEGHRRFCRITTTLVNHQGTTLLEGFHCYRIIAPSAAPAA